MSARSRFRAARRVEVVSSSGVVLGRDGAEATAELVVANLPPGCGPAMPGTADDLGGAETGVSPDPARR
jgi:hypothetical protein